MSVVGNEPVAVDPAEGEPSAVATAVPPRRGRGWLVLRRGVAATGLLACLAFAVGFFVFTDMVGRAERRVNASADAVVALTGGAQRIADAADLLKQGYARRLLISGVNKHTTPAQLADLNPELGDLVDCCVDLDYRARNTIGNAIETRRWVQQHAFRSLIVVTSNYHMPRSLVELGNVLPETELVPHAVSADRIDTERWWRDPVAAKLLFMEYLKYLVAVARTYVERDPEDSRVAVFVGGRKPVATVPVLR
ncbi:YdcF family protein [Chelatococcus daeguensis]|uniref:YdcF family protein n=1 Tax=Chelatococcus daeguensis TaxID=444444 RepID=UPI0009FB8766|nr:YdcF family protein [Chelatococcus daeguensis]